MRVSAANEGASSFGAGVIRSEQHRGTTVLYVLMCEGPHCNRNSATACRLESVFLLAGTTSCSIGLVFALCEQGIAGVEGERGIVQSL
jgi:hypothetical protein